MAIASLRVTHVSGDGHGSGAGGTAWPGGGRDTAAVLEWERSRIARDLHDIVAQALAALRFAVQDAIPTADARAAARLGEALGGIDDAIVQVRGLAFSLRPPSLDEGGLAAALRELVDRQARAADLDADVSIDPRLRDLPTDVETACYRIAQEAMTNVVKHAGARHVTVEARCVEGWLRVSVRDDGRGMASGRGGRRGVAVAGGVAGMAERAAAVGGTLEVRSRRGAGTAILAWLPCAGAVAGVAG